MSDGPKMTRYAKALDRLEHTPDQLTDAGAEALGAFSAYHAERARKHLARRRDADMHPLAQFARDIALDTKDSVERKAY